MIFSVISDQRSVLVGLPIITPVKGWLFMNGGILKMISCDRQEAGIIRVDV
ncbi:hypothetical protein SAMN05660706_12345 [Desulfoscipio geothermicus DSM 3669]|uniref:Uncharacterized protein n=1 Tax=Desulfoscipio geothermicus DSM 3669 TaxID=1121426 RepID=A0A1I6E1S7_9FIRM|nr:hypothetical protein SAMN05660706_12345 [Desulfoscipio geothermicus DSM 3669]